MTANRSKFAAGTLLGGSAEEKATAIETYVSYCGRYEIQADKVIHHVEASLFPNWVGAGTERFFVFTGDRLSLSKPPILMSDRQQTAHLMWERG